MKKKNKKQAFTLAEVLITLTIIGVVAAVSIPTLTKKTGNQETVTKLQKAYSVLSQATDEIILENGSPKNNWASDSDNIYNSYKEHLKNAKDCGANAGCWGEGKTKYLNGKNWSDINENTANRKLILADGTLLQINATKYISSACDGTASDDENVCTVIYVDLNGKKEPNTLGRDIFRFLLKADGLYPAGCNSIDECNSNNSGWNCTCRVLEEGEINY